MSNETQDLAEAGHGQQTAVLRVCNLPYLAQHRRRKLGALEELDGDLACDDAKLLCVGLLEEELEDALLIGREVEDGLVCACLAAPSTHHDDICNILNSPLAARSAMAVALQMGGRVVVMGEACNEAEAPSCRVIGNSNSGSAGKLRVPSDRRRKVGRLAAADGYKRQPTTTGLDNRRK